MALRLTPAAWRRLAALAVGLALLYASFEYGRSVAGYSALSSLMQRQALASRVSQLDAQRQLLERRVAVREVSGRVDAEAQSEAQAMIGELQAELARQQQELDFYRGLVAEKFGTGTIKVQELTVKPAEAGRFTVLVTLVHSATRDATPERSAKGSSTFTPRTERSPRAVPLRASCAPAACTSVRYPPSSSTIGSTGTRRPPPRSPMRCSFLPW